MGKKTLLLQQLGHKMQAFKSLQQVIIPPTGWIKAIRSALGMSAQQLGNKLSITRQGVQDMENREMEGSITIKSLRETARALDMELVYGFIPNDGTLEAMIERRAKDLAKQIVMRTSQSMLLENQENNNLRIERAIEEQAETIRKEMPKSLWD